MLASCSKEATDTLITTEFINSSAIETELFSLVNNYRISIGQIALKFDSVAYEQANEHNIYMITILLLLFLR